MDSAASRVIGNGLSMIGRPDGMVPVGIHPDARNMCVVTDPEVQQSGVVMLRSKASKAHLRIAFIGPRPRWHPNLWGEPLWEVVTSCQGPGPHDVRTTSTRFSSVELALLFHLGGKIVKTKLPPHNDDTRHVRGKFWSSQGYAAVPGLGKAVAGDPNCCIMLSDEVRLAVRHLMRRKLAL